MTEVCGQHTENGAKCRHDGNHGEDAQQSVL
jgi:hypothetical protein